MIINQSGEIGAFIIVMFTQALLLALVSKFPSY